VPMRSPASLVAVRVSASRIATRRSLRLRFRHGLGGCSRSLAAMLRPQFGHASAARFVSLALRSFRPGATDSCRVRQASRRSR
jgi:hypothetical protein